MNVNIKNLAFNLPWFMFDLSNFQLITSPIIPGDIKDTKDIIYTETPIPGLNYSPVQYGGGGNRHVSFSLQLVNRNNTIGNVLLLKQFDNLRNQTEAFSVLSGQFRPNPKVLYSWGLGSVPLVYFVKKCDSTHKQGWVNAMGMPQYSDIDIELILDESNPLYIAEEIFRKISSYAGMVEGAYSVVQVARGRRVF